MQLPPSLASFKTTGTPLAAAEPPEGAACQLAGEPALWLPVDKEEPAVLFFPAPEAGERQLRPVVDGLHAQRVNLLVVRPRGESIAGFASSGATLATAAVDLLASEEITGKLFLYAAGASVLPAVHAAAEHQKFFKGIFFEGAAVDISALWSADGTGCPDWERSLLAGISEITCTTTIFHGSADRSTPVAAAEKIQAESGARSKQFFVVPGGRAPGTEPLCAVGGEQFFDAIRRSIDSACGLNTWREQRRKRRGSRSS